MLEWMDRSVHTVEELKSALPVHVLGTIPRMRGGRSAALVGRIAQVDPRSDVAEAYRMIRTAIHFGMPRGQGAKVLVTSPHPGDGKTVTTSNLAIAMAQAGHRTLLIDADFRRPMQHVLYGIETEVGASSAAAGVVSPESVIRASGIDRLDILPCGEIPANPAGLLNSQQFANMIAKLSLKYDYLLIDSPPVIPVTDARILSAMCDSTILVLRAGKSTRKDCEQAVEALAAVGARSVGVLLNDLPARSGQYHYGDYNYTPRIDAGNQLTLESAGPATATAGNGNGNGNGKRTKWNQEEH
jgi:capsular exopolysaccharide synthesis family protein